MKTKLSFRKKVIIEIMSPTIVTATMGLIYLNGRDSILTNVILGMALLGFIVMLFNSYHKKYEPEDERAKHSQMKADSLSFNVMLVSLGGILLYSLIRNNSIRISFAMLLYSFIGMNLLNLVLFLYYDIRGN